MPDTPATSLMFIENVGQFDERVRFLARDGKTTLWLAEDALWLTLLADEGEIAGDGLHLRLTFPGANPNVRLEPFGRQSTRVSYFQGNEPDKWRPNVPIWSGVRYVNLYPGVNLEISSEDDHLAWQPTRPWSELPLRVEGADGARVIDGTLQLDTAVGTFSLPQFTLATAKETLPTPAGSGLLYSTFLGGSNDDNAYAVDQDADGNAYIAGFTTSPDFPAEPGVFYGGLDGDGYIVKVDAAGSNLLYAVLLGGSDKDYAFGMALGEGNEAYVIGQSLSADFPTTPGAFDTTLNGFADVFVVRLSPAGDAFSYSTFLGGSSYEYGADIAIDNAGNAHLTGYTQSDDFPVTPGAFDSTLDSWMDGFVAKLNADGDTLMYATFLGGDDEDTGWSIAVDDTGQAYVAGETSSSDFPTTPGSLSTTFNGGEYDAFLTKVDETGGNLTYSTFLGGSNDDAGLAVALDTTRNAIVTGSTYSDNFPATVGAFDATYGGGGDAFVVKVNPAGSALAFGTFIGGSFYDRGWDIEVSDTGHSFAAGATVSSDFPVTAEAFDSSHNGGTDAFVAAFDENGATLSYSTYLGGGDSDGAYAIAIADGTTAYLAGYTYSADWPTSAGAFDTSHNGSLDTFAAALTLPQTEGYWLYLPAVIKP